MEKRNKIRFIMTLLCAAWLGFIFVNSLLDGQQSSDMSGWVMKIAQSVLGFFSVPLELTEHFVRKAAHFTEYFILGALMFPTVKMYLKNEKTLLEAGVTAVLSFAAACFDELFIQTRIPGRCGTIVDSFIDLSGALTAVIILIAVKTAKNRRITEENK